MRSTVFARYTLTSCVASALLAACGGLQVPIGAQSQMPNAAALTTHAHSRPPLNIADARQNALPHAQSGDLLYVTTSHQEQLYLLTYPQLQVIDTIGGFSPAALHGLCSGPAGEVYVTDDGQQTSHLYLFKHGAKTSSKTLSGPGGITACSVNPTTGDVAATTVENRPALAIYSKGKGAPKIYDANTGYSASAYAPNGNLYLIPSCCDCLTLFANGTFTCVKLDRSAQLPRAGGLQWHNNVFVIAARAHHNLQTVYTVKLTSATTGRLVSTITLDRKMDEGPRSGLPALVAGNELMAPSHRKGLLSFWLYPKGGEPVKSVALKVEGFVSGLSLSPGK
ncbi:MAG: hypothetical protein WBE79_14960 [Candidatus Cybelea sp.]